MHYPPCPDAASALHTSASKCSANYGAKQYADEGAGIQFQPNSFPLDKVWVNSDNGGLGYDVPVNHGPFKKVRLWQVTWQWAPDNLDGTIRVGMELSDSAPVGTNAAEWLQQGQGKHHHYVVYNGHCYSILRKQMNRWPPPDNCLGR
jgi:hypothetical protein